MREFLKAYWPFLAIGVVGLLIALRFVEPAPPRTVTFAAGSPGGAYHAYALRYQSLLAEAGVDLVIKETAGSVENLRMLHEGDTDIALIQGGIAHPEMDPDMRALGGLFSEPVWVFVRKDFTASSFEDLKSARMAIGQEGSGTRALATALQAEWGADWPAASQNSLSGKTAKTALLSGQIDAVVYVAAIETPYVQDLLVRDEIKLIPFQRAPALARRYPALATNTLLRGVVDISTDLPTRDVPLVAPVAQIVV